MTAILILKHFQSKGLKDNQDPLILAQNNSKLSSNIVSMLHAIFYSPNGIECDECVSLGFQSNNNVDVRGVK